MQTVTNGCGCGKPKLTREEKELLPDHWYEMKNIILIYNIPVPPSNW